MAHEIKNMSAENRQVLSTAAFIFLAASVNGERPPDCSGVDHLPHGAENKRMTGKMGNGDFHLKAFCEFHHAVRFLQRGAERFFDQHVNTAFCRRFDRCRMIARKP